MADNFQSDRLMGKKDCRFYEAQFPEVEDCVMVQVGMNKYPAMEL